ncbi:MAG: hypothetical protein Q7S39_11060 [Ignavibacteria bacterium]|nr:hypothetical protein [Ignavibacteria bacterium]
MEITERDLFNYVFYKDLVDKDKVEFLEGNDTYKDEIDFFSSLKDSLSEEISSDLKKKIAQKIPAYNFSNLAWRQTGVIVLYPAVEKKNKQKRKDKLVLAADSAELKSQHTSQTFSDEKKQYLVKLINSDSNTKIFVFSTSESELKNLKLTLHPKEKEYLLKDNSNPLEVNEDITAESISLEFL